MPISEDQVPGVARSVAYDRHGRLIGPVLDVLADNHTGRPQWVTLAMHPAGTAGSAPGVRCAPLAGAAHTRGRLLLDVTHHQVVSSPAPPGGGADIDGGTEATLYTHYGLSPAGDTDVDPTSGTTARSVADHADHSLLPPAER